MSPDRRALATTNINSGLDWFKVYSDKVKRMSTSKERQPSGRNFPLPVAFINEGRSAMMGTSKGFAAIFDTRDGKKVQVLKHVGGKLLHFGCKTYLPSHKF
jgi:hypothetical protein